MTPNRPPESAERGADLVNAAATSLAERLRAPGVKVEERRSGRRLLRRAFALEEGLRAGGDAHPSPAAGAAPPTLDSVWALILEIDAAEATLRRPALRRLAEALASRFLLHPVRMGRFVQPERLVTWLLAQEERRAAFDARMAWFAARADAAARAGTGLAEVRQPSHDPEQPQPREAYEFIVRRRPRRRR